MLIKCVVCHSVIKILNCESRSAALVESNNKNMEQDVSVIGVY